MVMDFREGRTRKGGVVNNAGHVPAAAASGGGAAVENSTK